MSALERVAAGEAPAYICTRLFHPAGRLVGVHLERGVQAGLVGALTQAGLTPSGPLTFLPYRDSNGALSPLPGRSFTRDIYTLDAERVRQASLMVLPLDDLQIDSGVAFELGLAWRLGLPTLTVVLNSIGTQHLPSGTVLRLSPLLDALSDRIVDAGAFPLSGLPSDPPGYQSQVEGALQTMAERVREEIRPLLTCPAVPRPAFSRKPSTVHLEFGVPDEGKRGLLDRISQLLAREGWSVTRARRWDADDAAGLHRGAQADLAAACEAGVLLTLGDGADVDAEVAAVQGARTATGRPTVLLRTTPLGLWDGPAYRSVCNLMLAHSATHVASSVADAVTWVRLASPDA